MADVKIEATICLKVALRVLSKWECSQEQIQNILNIKNLESYITSKTNNQIMLSEEQIDRVSLILNIHASLVNLFNNEDNIYGFMKFKNTNKPFGGKTPLNLIETGNFEALKQVNTEIAQLLVSC